MLELDYSSRFSEVIQSLPRDIELPEDWSNFFKQRGSSGSCPDDERANQRMIVRAHCVMWIDRSLPFLMRGHDPVGVYTCDFSRQGCGFLSPFQLFPEERVRIALPTLWVRLRVVRARRIGRRCFEIGAALVEQHDPELSVFEDEFSVA